MSRFRYSVLENDKVLTAAATSGTETIDLPERGILSQLELNYRHLSTYTDNTMLPVHYAISKVEVLVNGSTVIKSLNASEIRALMWYNKGPYGQINDYDQSQSHNRFYHKFILYFGRNALDTKMGLDLAAYANPQLKFTYDEATTTHDGVTYDVCTSPTVTYNIMAKLIDGTPAGWMNKYVQTKVINQWTMAASEEKNTEIPRGQDLRGLMLRCGYKAKAYYDFWEHLKLDFDNGAWLPLDMDHENLVSLQHEAWPDPVFVGKYFFGADGDDLNAEMNYVVGAGYGRSRANLGAVKFPIIYWPINVIELKDSSGASLTGGGAQTGIMMGWGPMQTFYLPMKLLLDGEQETIKTTDFGRIDLKTTSGASASTSAIGRIIAEYDKTNGS